MLTSDVKNLDIIKPCVDKKGVYRVLHYNDLCKLFNELLNRNVSPLIFRLLSVLYTNQILQFKWKSITGADFSVLNGVKQGGVLSPVLFAVYIDGLLKWLSKKWSGMLYGETSLWFLCHLLMKLNC